MSEAQPRAPCVSSIDEFGRIQARRNSRKTVGSPATLDHMSGVGMQSTSNDNHHGRKWKRNNAPQDQMAPGRLNANQDPPLGSPKKSPVKTLKDAPSTDFFGPSELPSSAADTSMSSQCTQRSMARVELEKQRGLHKEGGIHGILTGAGAAEVPWSKKKHVEQLASKDHGRPGALVTNGHGAVQWAGLERKKQNLMQTSRLLQESESPSPRRNVRRMFNRTQADTTAMVHGNDPRRQTVRAELSAADVQNSGKGCSDKGEEQADKMVGRPVSAYPSVVTHSISPPKRDRSGSSSLSAFDLQHLSLGGTLGSSSSLISNLGSSVSSIPTSRTGSVSSQQSDARVPQTRRDPVPPHLRTSTADAPWAHTALDIKSAEVTTFGKKRFDRPQTASSLEAGGRRGGVRAGTFSSSNTRGGLAAPWGVDL